jgi:hypothetical protein
MSAVPQVSCDWQKGFLAVLPAVETHAKIQFRRLPREQRENAVQEAIASAVVAYRRLAARGRLHVAHPSCIAINAVHHVWNGRHVGGCQSGSDVMSVLCHRRHHVEVVSYDRGRLPASLRDGAVGWKAIAVEDRKVNIPALAAFRVDFAVWLETLTRRDRLIIGALSGGNGTKSVAEQFRLSEGRVSQLRRKFEQLWRIYQGEAEAAA